VPQPTSALQVLNTTFGYPSFRGPQADIIEHIEAGNDALVLMPTGGGKSLCYQIPALTRNGVGIVVSPLIALMQDQVDALHELGVSAAFLNSSLTGVQANDTERRVRNGEIKLLYVAPERLLTERFLELLDELRENNQLALFAIDEAHCVSQWGHDFRSDYLALSVLAERFPGVPRIALTATADALTRTEIRLRLHMQDAREFVSSFDRPNIRYLISERVDERAQLRAFLREHAGEAGIVYCLSRKKVDATAEWLNAEMTKALPYHAGMDQDTRRRNQSRFLREEGIVMVATIAFGMGIDKPDVRFVVHLDLPKSVEGYYQETGRAGRDGDDSEAMMIYGLADVVQQRRFIEQSEANDDFKRAGRAKLEALLGLCETTACRRGRLLSYFGELQPEGYACGNCDTCLSPPKMWDATELVRMALSAIYRTGQRFGATYVIEVLQGKTTTQIKERGHDTSPVHGIGKDHDEAAWRNVFRQIVTHGWAEIDVTAYGALRLTAAARPVLRGEVPAMLRQQLAVGASTKAAKAAKAKRGAKDASGSGWTGGVGGVSGASAVSGKVAVELTPADEVLYESLKAWRLQAAREANVPAFVILHDSVLREIAASRPKNKTALAAISGIGESKLARFGDGILERVGA